PRTLTCPRSLPDALPICAGDPRPGGRASRDRLEHAGRRHAQALRARAERGRAVPPAVPHARRHGQLARGRGRRRVRGRAAQAGRLPRHRRVPPGCRRGGRARRPTDRRAGGRTRPLPASPRGRRNDREAPRTLPESPLPLGPRGHVGRREDRRPPARPLPEALGGAGATSPRPPPPPAPPRLPPPLPAPPASLPSPSGPLHSLPLLPSLS